MLLSQAHGYTGPVHDELSVGGREVSAGYGRDQVTTSQIHALANSPALLGNTPSAFQLDPYALPPCLPPPAPSRARAGSFPASLSGSLSLSLWLSLSLSLSLSLWLSLSPLL